MYGVREDEPDPPKQTADFWCQTEAEAPGVLVVTEATNPEAVEMSIQAG
jgi:hypothetical protein